MNEVPQTTISDLDIGNKTFKLNFDDMSITIEIKIVKIKGVISRFLVPLRDIEFDLNMLNHLTNVLYLPDLHGQLMNSGLSCVNMPTIALIGRKNKLGQYGGFVKKDSGICKKIGNDYRYVKESFYSTKPPLQSSSNTLICE